MDLHEKSIDPCSGGGARQRFDKFPPAAGCRPSATRQLNAVRRVKDDRIPEVPHNRKGPHIHDKIVVTK